MAAARFAGLMRMRITFLGFRASALHPRLYSAARIRGLKMRTSIWRKSLGNDKLFKAGKDSRNKFLVAAATIDASPAFSRLGKIDGINS